MRQTLKVVHQILIWIFALSLYTTNDLWEEELFGFLVSGQLRNFAMYAKEIFPIALATLFWVMPDASNP